MRNHPYSTIIYPNILKIVFKCVLSKMTKEYVVLNGDYRSHVAPTVNTLYPGQLNKTQLRFRNIKI